MRKCQGKAGAFWLRAKIVPFLAILIMLFGATATTLAIVESAKAVTIPYSSLGYPWASAVCATPDPSTGKCDSVAPIDYDNWGYKVCPSNDMNCMAKVLNGYGVYDKWNYYLRNCTSFVAWKLWSLGVDPKYFKNLGDGGSWYTNAKNYGLVSVGTTPKVGAAAVAPGHDHVAYVSAINNDGTITIQEYNHDEKGDGDTWTGLPSNRGFTEYVYFASKMTNPSITPASISFNGALNVFTVGGDNQVYQTYWNGSSWSGFSSIGGSFVSNPAVIINVGALNIFERGPDNQIYTEYNGGNGWSGWSSSLGRHQMKGNPAVIHYGSEMDVFALDTNNVPYKATWNSTIDWGSGWTSMGNFMASSPAAIQYGSEMDVFYRGGDNNIYKNTWNGSSWGGFGSLGSPNGTTITGNPSVLSYTAEGEYDIYVNTTSGHIYKRMWNGSWTGWADMGGGFVGNPYAMQYGSDMSLFARGTNNQIYHRYWSYSGQFWSGWGSLGGNLASDPFALQYGSSELDVFATGTDGKTDHDTFTPTNGWGGFSAL